MLDPDSNDLRKLFDLSVDLLCVVSPEGRIVACNSMFQRSLGYTDEWLSAHTMFDTVHPDDRASVAAATEKVVQGETTVLFENRCLTATGEVRWVQWNARTDPSDWT